jgi:serine O-acetyltransferase
MLNVQIDNDSNKRRNLILKPNDLFYDQLLKAHKEASRCPPPEMVIRFFEQLLGVLFPEFAIQRFSDRDALKNRFSELKKEFRTILDHNIECVRSGVSGLEDQFFNELPAIRAGLILDVNAMYEGDPAAKSIAEVIRTYPGFYAISAHRIAHCLLNFGVNLIPRIISEHAHRETGIDIHPGAQIGDSLCIDHGTGIVIGETTIIGSNVKFTRV